MAKTISKKTAKSVAKTGAKARTKARAKSEAKGLDRKIAVPRLIGNPGDFLFVSGLAGTAKDLAHLTKDGDNLYALAGAMGAATMMGLGLALAQPDRRVLVATGDGELLMNVGALATISVLNPPNLSIVCVDNGHYGETGYQLSHTSLGVDLEQMAIGAGIKSTRTVSEESQLEDAARALRESNGTSFVLLKVAPTEPASYQRDLRPAATRHRFMRALLGR
ncbi:MAG: thiamine pyrophosphate-dependent acetolactate synthase large subunit-like protein [Gammaproteobacteria bacterium]|jgi:thiamine pyrophosphate-dependent acetolactate synthase large subunit-like protein